jgi:hypothetical protein
MAFCLYVCTASGSTKSPSCTQPLKSHHYDTIIVIAIALAYQSVSSCLYNIVLFLLKPLYTISYLA